MLSFTPLCKTYSAVSSSLSSSDDAIQISNPNEIAVQTTSKSTPRTIPRHSFLIRVIIFVLLESSFIALVSIALWRPIILPLSFTITEVKSAVTAIAILWHALAVYIVKDILLNIFSAEWMEQSDGPQHPGPILQELDTVSRLTTGFIDQAKHSVSKRATHPFRLAFLSSLLLILLNGLGPSAIGVDIALYDYPSTIQVANLTLEGDFDGSGAAHRAITVVELEVVENSTSLGFSSTQPNVLIPWPSSDSTSENMSITYQSDIIRYNFSCSWERPWRDPLDGTEWIRQFGFATTQYGGSTTIFYGPSIHPLAGSFSDYTPKNTSFASFLFIGGNITQGPGINLEDVPSSLLPCNTENPGGFSRFCVPLLVSVLQCDPCFEISPATIKATTSSVKANILPGTATMKNIPTSAAEHLFSHSLLEAAEFVGKGGMSDILHQLFLPKSPLDFSGKNPCKPLSLDKINQNMTNVLTSSAKTYLSGYNPNYDNQMLSTFVMFNTSGMMGVPTMALVGSKPFLVASSVTFGLLVILLGALVVVTRPDQLEAFELENIVQWLQVNHHSDGLIEVEIYSRQ